MVQCDALDAMVTPPRSTSHLQKSFNVCGSVARTLISYVRIHTYIYVHNIYIYISFFYIIYIVYIIYNSILYIYLFIYLINFVFQYVCILFCVNCL